MLDDKKRDIEKYVSEQIDILKKELDDESKYKRNPYPDETSTIKTLKDGEV